jgi:hypothetical protein
MNTALIKIKRGYATVMKSIQNELREQPGDSWQELDVKISNYLAELEAEIKQLESK